MSVEQLRRQRGAIKARLTSAKNFINRAIDNVEITTKEEIESRIEKLEETLGKYQAISQQLAGVASEEEYERRDAVEDTEFEDRYFSVRALFLQCLEKLKPSSQASTSGSTSQASDNTLTMVLEQQVALLQHLSHRSNESSNNDALSRIIEQQAQMMERLSMQSSGQRESQVKLPIIKLPTFDGNIEEWRRYADTFKTVIHNSNLSDVQKHQYLAGSLSGQAARVIESIEISDQNYSIAWELLKKRYEDERAIRKRHIQCLFELPRVQRESAGAIRELVDYVQKHLRVLHSMELLTDSWGELIIYLIEKNLDNATRRRWEEHAEGLENLTTNTMIEFLQRRCQVLERAALSEGSGVSTGKSNLNSHEGNDSGKKRQPFYLKSQNKTSLATTIQGGRCYYCQGQHLICFCNQFLRLSVEDRLRAVKRLKLCINCLRDDHFVSNCKSGSRRDCGNRHNTLCHQSREETGSTAEAEQGVPVNADKKSSCPSVHHTVGEPKRNHILLSTAIVNAKGDNNYNCQLRILLDSASEVNFVTLSACKKLGLKLNNVCEVISGLSNMNYSIKHSCRLQLNSRVSDFEMDLHCLVVPQITKELPSFSIRVSQLPIPGNLRLADPLFYAPGTIDALVGGEFFFKLLENGRLELDRDLPTLQNSKFGWIIAGSIPGNLIDERAMGRVPVNAHTCLLTQQESVNDTLLKFWELEEYPTDKRVMSTEDQECEDLFVDTMTRDTSGRYIVRLPFRKNKAELGESRQIAMKRLIYLERKFQGNQEFYNQYSQFMQEYIQLNHMSRVVNESNTILPVYLPHHGVLRESSISTKMRVVFDGSAKTNSGISLNDTLMIGAKLQDNIIDIILRFRLHVIAITADMKKMYRQVLIHENDRDCQRILWRFSTREPVQEFRLNTVTYGLACAPFLAMRCVKHLASDASSQYGQASQVLLNDLYVDDILTGVNSRSDAIELMSQLKALLHGGGFELHKWRSNCMDLLSELETDEHLEKSEVAIDINNSNVKTLGLNWHPARDMFEFSVQSMTDSMTGRTKREVLSAISKLFDPLGLVSPILIRAKLIMQEIWAANLDWDDPLTVNLQQAWTEYVEDQNNINTIQIPRRVISATNATKFYIHAFCDASIKAYGACIYLQSADNNGILGSALLCAKSRVAPMKSKTITLPRLELCGAVVLARLLKNVREAVRFEFDGIYAWSDSTIVLAWISGDPSRQRTFVSNRIAEIQSTVPSNCWHHVKSENNPADLISRGTSLKNLHQNKLWWEGPDWLARAGDRLHNEKQPTRLSHSEMEIVKSEHKSELQIYLNIKKSKKLILTLVDRYSSLSKLERVLARVLRFVSNCKLNQKPRRCGNISTDEIHRVNQLLVKEIQKVHFASELSSLKTDKQIDSSSKLLSLSPFIDENGLLRVGGRIRGSVVAFDTKHPILLPYDNKFTQLLFEREHRRLLHAGPQTLLYAIREKYWPIKGKNVARKVVRNCIICCRNNPKPLSQIMGQLPVDRVTPKRPFLVTGIDFAGPIITLINRGRGRKTNKSYISLFICFTTKAMHLEAVSDLRSDSFIAALKRLIGRRGYPQRIYCDNATNFVGARNELHEIRRTIINQAEDIDEFCVSNKIDWKFIPPASPHMGGLWEAGVKSCKYHLKRVVGNNLLTFEELTTVLVQIEACLNSRPICQLPSASTDLLPLTPGHFLVGESLMSVPEVDLSDVPVNRLDRWQLVQKTARDFWNRWSKEYLTSLQSKTKWKTEKTNLSIDDIVLIQDNNLPPLKWRLGKVIELHPDTDDKVRVVTLKNRKRKL